MFESAPDANVQQAVPFFMVSEIEKSVGYYVDQLGFTMKLNWAPNGKLQWCWLQHGSAALMLQEYRREEPGAFKPQGKLGEGVSICFICHDALAIYRDVKARGANPSRPFVGNNMWVTSLTDPDGYRIDFESVTDAPEESVYSEDESSSV